MFKIYLLIFTIILPIIFFVSPAFALTPAKTVCQQGQDPEKDWCENFPGTIPPKNCIGSHKYYNPETRDCSGSGQEENTEGAPDVISLDTYFIYGVALAVIAGVSFYVLTRVRGRRRNQR